MRMVSEIMQTDVAWVNPNHKVRSAIILLKGHNVSSLPVLEGRQLVGSLHARNLLGIGDRVSVSDVMERDAVAVPMTSTVREAAEVMMLSWRERLPVVNEEGDLVGFISHQDLLSELRRPSDPLTELPWSDTMREWAIEQLHASHEITIIFIDVNDFGLFNKRFGHVVGDMVLQNVANLLRDLSDKETDLVCRYGGDEFCIATLRHATEASIFADRIEREVASLRLVETDSTRISVTTGLRGGRRTRERETIHYAATLNDLINLASRDCILRKQQEGIFDESGEDLGEASKVKSPTLAVVSETNPSSAEAEKALSSREGGGKIELTDVQAQRSNGNILVQVDLRVLPRNGGNNGGINLSAGSLMLEPVEEIDEGGEPLTASETHAGSEVELRKLVVDATVTALKKLLPPDYDLNILEVIVNGTADGRDLVTVHGYFTTPEGRRPISGSAFLQGSDVRPMAAATLSAINRQMEPFLARLLEGEKGK